VESKNNNVSTIDDNLHIRDVYHSLYLLFRFKDLVEITILKIIIIINKIQLKYYEWWLWIDVNL